MSPERGKPDCLTESIAEVTSAARSTIAKDSLALDTDEFSPHKHPRSSPGAPSTASAETRIRPAARAALTAVLRAGPTSADVARFAAIVGLTRQ